MLKSTASTATVAMELTTETLPTYCAGFAGDTLTKREVRYF